MEMALVLATPHPDLDIHALFAHYNATYFDNALSSCFVEWSSPRQTSCLATCDYQKGSCQITLSQPLLKYLTADHVKNTLLHEMIHAYLFVTKNQRKHGTHGPEFRNIIDSIHFSTKDDSQRPPSGYKITLFHDFHDDDEVDDSIANYWMCKKCGDRIKRATTAKPSHADCIVQEHHAKKTCSLADCRWHRHKAKCGGIYTKIQKLDEHHDKKKPVPKGLIRLFGEESLENGVLENDKSVTTLSKEKFSPSSANANSSATSQCITYRRNLKGTSRSKFGSGEINIKPDIQGLLCSTASKSLEGNTMKGKSPQVRSSQKKAALCQAARASPYSAKEFSQEKPQRSAPHQEAHFRKAESSFLQIGKANQKSKASEKKVETKVQTTREITRYIPSEGKSHTSPMKMNPSRKPEVTPRRKAEFSSPNMSESCRKRKLTKKECISQGSDYKVVSKWLDYYEDESTDEEIEPLLNRKIIRNKRMKILRESIQREKEEKERKLREAMEMKLLCLPWFSRDNVVDISDDDSS